MSKLVAIHQPNFFPWLGYFDKIRRADVFIILDDAQQQKTGGTWSNRVKIAVAGEPKWISAPIDRAYSGVRPINEIAFSDHENWRVRMVKTLGAAYARAPFFHQAMAVLEPLIMNSASHLAEYNISGLTALAGQLGLDISKCRLSSSFEIEGSATQRLIALTRAAGGDGYLCGGGATGYQEDQAFADAGLKLVYQDYRPPRYAQSGNGEFIAGLSIIDTLMNLGVEGSANLLASVP